MKRANARFPPLKQVERYFAPLNKCSRLPYSIREHIFQVVFSKLWVYNLNMAKECFERCPEIILAKAAVRLVEAFAILPGGSPAVCQSAEQTYRQACQRAAQCPGPEILKDHPLTPTERLLNFPPRVRCQRPQ